MKEKEIIQSNPKKASSGNQKYTNLNYLKQITKNNSTMMTEMIKAYLEETPRLINSMKKGIEINNWELLRIAAHSIIPSFSTMGIDKKFEITAKTIQDHATELQAEHQNKSVKKETKDLLNELILKTEMVCAKAYEELQREMLALKLS